MNTELQTVYDSFLSKVTDYGYLNLNEEELAIELNQTLKSSIAKFLIVEELSINEYTDEFNRELSLLEIEILAYGMVLSWIEPKINSIDLLRQRLGSKEFQMFSQANHLKELREIKLQAKRDFDYWINRYASMKALEEMKK